MKDAKQRADAYLDVTGGLLFVAFAAVLWIQRDYNGEYSGYFPDFLLIIMPVLGIGLTVRGALGRGPGVTRNGDTVSGIVRALLLLVLCFSALPILGYVATSVIFFTLTATLMRGRNWSIKGLVLDAIVAVALVSAIYLMFSELLLVQLP